MSAIGKTVGKGLKAIGLTSIYKAVHPDPARKASEIVMPDEEALKLSARRRHSARARRAGRQSTILETETLG